MKGKKKIGLFFGSFNPLTRAHLEIALHAENNYMDEVWFVVSPANPDKFKKGILIHEDHRLNMAVHVSEFYNRMIRSNIFASNVEFGLPKPSWTDDSIKAIIEQLDDPNLDQHELYIICGKDTHRRIQNWKNKDYVIETCKFLVFDRSGSKPVDYAPLHERSEYVTDFEALPISSTLVREKLNKGGKIHDLVPDVVDLYIREHGLFQDQ